ncbi:hypothetical protein E0H86_11565 [Acinetobacter sp. ANC 4635]|uniref:hypothetical protein n=1 Tax=Acinetobacter sp. ANC 4635 TaxID=2529846 RepID=UPI0010389523|nr:hypothetical protein [Acinetobacter sp. ANC 4635]TCB28444.1 hypothetical protein E0H86_11565 [Acinetobacter sp. ANC 4635]
MNFKTNMAWLWKMLKKHWFKLFAGILIFYSFILPWYAIKYHSNLPPQDQLYKEVGTLNYERVDARRGYLVGITSHGQTNYFTCRSPMSKRNDCLISQGFDELKANKGKPAEVLWFKQDQGIGYSQRLVALKVDGKTWVSLKEGERQLSIQRKGIDGFTVFALLFMFSIFWVKNKLE